MCSTMPIIGFDLASQVEQHGIGVVVRNAAGQLSWALEGYVVNMAGYEPRTG